MGKYILGCLGLLVIGIIALVVIGGAIWADSYNKLVGLKQSVDSQWADVENQYQRRADLIPNLVQNRSGAANFEKSTLTEVTDARASVGQIKLDPSQAPSDPHSCSSSSRHRAGSAMRCRACWSSRKIIPT